LGDVLCVAMDDSLVYRKSGLGAAQLAAPHGGPLSTRERHVLILLDGRRTISELHELFGVETVERVVAELEAKGFAKRVDTMRGDGWDAVTQFHPGLTAAAVAPKPAARARPWDRYPLTVAFVAAGVVAVVGGYWATDRYRRQADAMSRWDQAFAQVAPIDGYGVSRSTGTIGVRGVDPRAALIVTPISGLPAVTAPESVTRAAPPAPVEAAPLDRKAVARTPVRAAVPAPAAAVKENATVPVTPPRQLAVATGIGAPPTAAPVQAPIAAAAPAAPQESTVAMQGPAAQPGVDPAGLRPLQHDPPRFPESAVSIGIVQSQVRARLWVTPEGKVDQVDIIEATPPRLLDDEVRRALSLWTFEPPNHPTEQVVDLTLRP